MTEEYVLFRLRKRAEIRRQIKDRKSVQEGKPDRISDLLDEAADEIERIWKICHRLEDEKESLGLKLSTYKSMWATTVNLLKNKESGFICEYGDIDEVRALLNTSKGVKL